MGKFQIVGTDLVGPGLSFEAAELLDPTARSITVASAREVLVHIADVTYHAGRRSMLPSFDDRYDLHNAVETLRAMAVIVGPLAGGDRHRRAADIIARLLREQEA